MLEKLTDLLNHPKAKGFLHFDEMITPTLIRIGYWLSLVAVLIAGLGRAFEGGFGHFVSGIVFMVVGAIIARVLAELVILIFKIQEDIETVAKNTATQPATRKKTTSSKTTKKVTKKA